MYQPPAGARDLLPLDVAQKGWIEDRLQSVFQHWNYHRIIPPTLERLETLTAGGAVQPETVIQVWDAEEGVLGLRPELTASIARAAVTRIVDSAYPQRLFYNANVFRRQPGPLGGQHEFFQLGVELLGGSGLLADAETLLLLADGLRAVGLQEWHLILGEAGLTRSLLCAFPEALRPSVRHAIAQLDRVGLGSLPLSPALRKRAMALLELRGHPGDVLQQIAQWPLDPTQEEAVTHLKSLVEVLGSHPSVVLDLSLIQTFDYYTGIVFEVVSESDGGQRVLGQGGRYDQLLGLYHPQGQQIPGIGFCLNMEDLHQVLLTQGLLPRQTLSSDWLVVAAESGAIAATFDYAQQLRAQTGDRSRVEVELSQRSAEATREYARHRQIGHIAWVSASKTATVESLK
jgi:ATP phosphoribosyltransferase regulatory subunit